MADAYKCDLCERFEREPYHDGRPSKTLYEETHNRAQKIEYLEILELCGECAEDLGVIDDDE